MNTRFPHRFDEKDLSKRNWVFDISIYKTLTEAIEHLKSDSLYYKNWLYCAATAPIDGIISDLEELESLLKRQSAGDIIEFWVLSEEPKYLEIKCPNNDGLFPTKGSY